METKKGSYTYEYPRPSVTTDCVIFGYDIKEGLSVLLIERGVEPYKGRWAFPGGFLRMDETTEAGALRELKEETEFDVEKGFLEQLGCFSDVDRDPRGRVLTIACYALVQKGAVKGGDDARNAQWYPIGEVSQLAFDHEKILRMALKHLKEQIHFQPIGFECYQRHSQCHSFRHCMRLFWRYTSTAGISPTRCSSLASWKRLASVRRMRPEQFLFSTGSILTNTRK